MGKRKSKGKSYLTSSKNTTPQVSDHDSSPEPPTKKKKNSGPKSSSELCADYNVQDVELEYTDADYQNLTTYNLFVRLIRPQISAANPKFIPASKMNQIMEAKWREFTESNPFSKDSKEEEDEDEDDDEDDDDDGKSEKEDQINGNDEDEDEDKNEEKHTGSNTEDYDKSSDDSDHLKRKSKSRESRGGRKSTGSLKIKLPMAFGIRKSAREKRTPKKIDEDIEKFFDTEDDSPEDSKPKRQSKKKKLSSDDDFESEDEAPKLKRRSGGRAAKKRKKSSGSSSSSSLSSSTTSDSDSSTEKGKRKSRKSTKKDEKLVIPGERRSERARKSISAASLKEMTDREFEKMLKKQDEKKKKDKRKEEKTRKRRLKQGWKIKGKRGAWQDDDKEVKSGEESDHCWFCAICKDGGDLLLCDGCPKSYHQKCLKIEEIPEGDWKCPPCLGEELPEVSEEEEEEGGGHDHFCKECGQGGDLLLCDFCPKAYHMGCVNPPLKEIPEGQWKCTRCVMLDNPPKEFITKILTWRWVNVKHSKDDELDHTMSPRKKSEIERNETEDSPNNREKKPERELFVKFRYHSYWDCEWIPELMLLVHQKFTWTSFKKKWDQNEPPAINDGGEFSRHHKKSEDPLNLYERYYRWGVKPEWLQIHRIISHEKENSKLYKYLVKWKELTYEDATFEAEDDLPEGLQDFKKHVDIYWSRRKEKESKEKQNKKEKKEKPKKKDLKKKLEKQQDYFDKTGGKLHPYQLEGLNWMRFSWAQDTNVILADEMGLGKTIQAIAFLRCLFKEGYAPGPFLISAPLSTVPNWEREFEFWAPDMYVVTYLGSRENRAIIRERDMCYREGAFHQISSAGRFREGYSPKFDVLLTSYEMVNVDKTTLHSIPYSVLVIDEAHRLKNNQSLFFRVMNEYKIDYKLLLTGTPLQNTLEELFNLLSFLEPGKFDNMEDFLNQFEDIGKEEQVKHLHDLLAPHMLRRLKMDVLKDIPDKCELLVRVELSALQKKYYKHILTRNFSALNVKGHGNQTSLINIMMDLRKCANHPYLFPTADQEAPLSKQGSYEGSALTKASGKLDLLSKMLKVLRRDGHRVLIFSQMTRVLNLLEDFMDFHNYNYERIDGSVTGGLRQERIDRFNDPESSAFAFLLSTRAGGLGINLATADTVVIFDMDWNPHNDIQAFSRAHRIGQKNKVMIYRFVCRNTVEEKITQVCKSKMMLSELVIAKGGVEKKESLTKQEVNDILKFGAESLFKDTEEGRVTYDDDAVEKLLDRSQAGEAEKQFGMNEYLRSFNVATYKIKEGIEEEEEKENEEVEEVPIPKSSSVVSLETVAEDDSSYWARVLGDSYADHLQQLEKEQADIAKSLGKGKRVRKQINYAETALMSFMSEKDKKKMMNVEVLQEDEDNDEQYMSDYRPDDSGSSSEEEEAVDENLLDPEERRLAEMARRNKQFIKEQKELKRQRERMKVEKGRQIPEALPPLLAKVNGQIEVLGFTARQRRAFLDSVMRFGMPPEDVYKSQWLVRDLRMKNERVFKAYMSLFMRHLCEPIPEDADKFADGVPREGLSRQHVLTRIGMIALIRRKVSEYEKSNGISSMAEYHTVKAVGKVSLLQPLDLLNITTVSPNKEKSTNKNEENKTDEQKDKENKESEVNKEEQVNSGKDINNSEKMEKEVQSSEKNDTEKKESEKLDKDMKSENLDVDKNGDKMDTDVNGEKVDTDNKEDVNRDKDVNCEKVDTDAKEGEKVDTDAKESKKVDTDAKESEKVDTDSKESEKVDTDSKESEKVDTDAQESEKVDTDAKESEKVDTDAKESEKVDTDAKESEKVDTDAKESEKVDTDTKGGEKVDTDVKESEKGDTVDEEKKSNTSSEIKEVKDEGEPMEVEDVKETTSKENADEETSKSDENKQDKIEDVMDTDEKQEKNDIAADKEENKNEREQNSKDCSDKVVGENSEGEKETDSAVSEVKKEITEKDPVVAEEKDNEKETKQEDLTNKEKDGLHNDNKDSEDKIETKHSSKDSAGEVINEEKSMESSCSSKDSNDKQVVVINTPEKSSQDEKVSSEKSESSDQVISDKNESATTPKEDDTSKEGHTTPKEGTNVHKDKLFITPPQPRRGMYNGHVIKTLSEIQAELRRRFWISDGGFTELHAVWNHEESLLIPGREWEMWHRRHDYWLLTGVITHGYRHWQDIMNDPRFEILNKAFRIDADRLKRAAFLNRRFQLLEQALVIEEQLRKAAVENTSHFQAAIEEVKEAQGKDACNDLLLQVDQFAANLRKISHGMKVSGPPPDAKVHKAISTLSGLITDIRQITYKTMPSTLAMTEHGAQSAKQSMLAKQLQKDAAASKVITVD